MRQAVILAGGKGTRLAERLHGKPKPLVDVDGIPLLGRQIAALRSGGFTDVIVLVNHAADQIAAYCQRPEFDGLRIVLVNDGEPRGTAGALLHAWEHLAERFLVVYGDTVFDVDLQALWLEHAAVGAAGTLFLHPNDHPFDSDLVELVDDGFISAFHRPPHDPQGCLPNLVNAAMYVLEREPLAFWRTAPAPSDIARDLFPAMLRRGVRLRGHVSHEYIKDIGTPSRLDKAVAQLRGGFIARARRSHPQRAVFLDRDGTLNVSRGHLARAEDFELIHGSGTAIRLLNAAEFRVVVATNQPVLARGEASFGEMRRIHARMDTLLGREGGFVDAVYLCPHHPDAGFEGEVPALKVVCDCRKPATGLIERAQRELNIDLGRSWFIGDTTLDMLAAARAGLRSILVETGEAGRDGRHAVEPDFRCRDLAQAAAFVTQHFPALRRIAVQLAGQIKPGQLVLVGGLARHGKSTFASVLRLALIEAGLAAASVSLDGFLLDATNRGDGVLGRYDLAAFAQAVAPWLQGGDADLRVGQYDRIARRQSPVRLHKPVPRDAVLIVEGTPVLSSLAFQRLATARSVLRIFIDGAEAARRERTIDDLVTRGLSPSQADALYQARQLDEAPLVLSGRDRADLVLSFDGIFNPNPKSA